MTRMIPSTVHSSVKSPAERRLFRIIEESPHSDEWTCLHSLGLARHEYKRRAEIDFCLITENGIFVLEVKGGRVSRSQGKWIFTDRWDNEYTKSESPFDQASSAMFSLENDLKKRFKDSAIASTTFGFGVLFPDIEFTEAGTEAAQEQVYDRRDRRRPFADYVRRLTRYTKSRESKPTRKLSKEDRGELVGYLRGDFDLVPMVGTVLDDTRSQLAQLTQEQLVVLDAVQDTQRILVDGPAGSGKTLLAMESARREARSGRQVAFLCYNRQLAAMAKAQLAIESYPGSIHVATVHKQFQEVVAGSSLREEFEEIKRDVGEDELFQSLYPDYAALAAMELSVPPYDVVVLDEAQDILTEANLRALGELIKGGLEGGRWRFFLDANDQACIYGRMDPDTLAEVRRLAQREPILTLNCRNTKPIGIQINVVAQPSQRTVCRAEGPAVEFLTYKTEAKILGKLEQALNAIRNEKIGPGHVSVLFPESPSDEQIRKLDDLGIKRLTEEDVSSLGTDSLDQVTWSVVSGFKGLENDVVVVVGIRDIEDDWWRSVTYVGLSRARVRLYVIVHECCTPIREERFATEFARSLQYDGETQ